MNIKQQIDKYYSSKIKAFGANPQGVDWNSKMSQFIRFAQLLKVCRDETMFSVNDLGCGYGALFQYLIEEKLKFKYFGYDISQAMINRAQELYRQHKNCVFYHGDKMKLADYTVASGIFNVKMKNTGDTWMKYILETITQMNDASRRGFAFNALTKYSDKEKMRPDLFYADPCFLFDYCKRKFSRNVALLHDYDLYEFTIVVRKI